LADVETDIFLENTAEMKKNPVSHFFLADVLADLQNNKVKGKPLKIASIFGYISKQLKPIL